MIFYCYVLFFFCLNDSATAFASPRRRYAQSKLSIIETKTRSDDDVDIVLGVDNSTPTFIKNEINRSSSSSSSSLSSRSRRWVVSSIVSLVSSSSIKLLSSQQIPVANAAPPLTVEIVDGIAARFERTILRPKPAKVLRSRLNIDFAILLMRSSYNALDGLDVVPMEQFQRDFFLLREAEYKTYADYLGMGVLQQGDLADPNYFDFISFAQYATVSREFSDPQSIFEEQQPVADDDKVNDVGNDASDNNNSDNNNNSDSMPQRFNTVIVRRDTTIMKSELPKRHSQLVGQAILNTLNDKFGTTASAIPKLESNGSSSPTVLLAAIKQLVNLFVISGFAWDGDASILLDGGGGRKKSQQSSSINSGGGGGDDDDDDRRVSSAVGTQFVITFTSPATLWSGQSLKAQNAISKNDFAYKTICELLSRAGYGTKNASVKYDNYKEITTFTVI